MLKVPDNQPNKEDHPVQKFPVDEKDCTEQIINSFATRVNNAYFKNVQNGYQSKTDLETAPAIIPGKPSTGGNGKQTIVLTSIKADTVNKYKREYMDGYEVAADYERLNGREKQTLKEVRMPALIKGQNYQGSIAYTNANGFNGLQKFDLVQKVSCNISPP